MPKTFGNLFEQICTFEALHDAYRRARRGKRSRPDVAAFELRCEDQLLRLRDELQDGSYRPGAYRSFRVTESGKQRVISAAPFRDRVVHHALCSVLEPIWEPRFIAQSYASRPCKGTHAAIDQAQHYARGHRYALAVDVQQFFPSIDHTILRTQLARHIRDVRVLALIDQILEGGAATMRASAGFGLAGVIQPKSEPAPGRVGRTRRSNVWGLADQHCYQETSWSAICLNASHTLN